VGKQQFEEQPGIVLLQFPEEIISLDVTRQGLECNKSFGYSFSHAALTNSAADVAAQAAERVMCRGDAGNKCAHCSQG